MSNVKKCLFKQKIDILYKDSWIYLVLLRMDIAMGSTVPPQQECFGLDS